MLEHDTTCVKFLLNLSELRYQSEEGRFNDQWLIRWLLADESKDYVALFISVWNIEEKLRFLSQMNEKSSAQSFSCSCDICVVFQRAASVSIVGNS